MTPMTKKMSNGHGLRPGSGGNPVAVETARSKVHLESAWWRARL